jgi:hypothetical protein
MSTDSVALIRNTLDTPSNAWLKEHAIPRLPFDAWVSAFKLNLEKGRYATADVMVQPRAELMRALGVAGVAGPKDSWLPSPAALGTIKKLVESRFPEHPALVSRLRAALAGAYNASGHITAPAS